MQNPTQKYRQGSIVFEKPSILSENLKTLTSFKNPTVHYFFTETSHTFPTFHVSKQNKKNPEYPFLDII